MAHNLNIKPNGKAAFVSKKKLHKLGTIIWLLRSYGIRSLNFELKRPLYVNGGDMNFEEAKQYARIQKKDLVSRWKITPVYNKNLLNLKISILLRTDNDYP
jgi:hypothetical protein